MARTEDERRTEHLQLEELLSDALRPIEPPESLAGRVERTLTAITEQAAAELSSWAEELSEGELDALRDPRNWVRPVAAVAVGHAGGRRARPGRHAPPPPADRPARHRRERHQDGPARLTRRKPRHGYVWRARAPTRRLLRLGAARAASDAGSSRGCGARRQTGEPEDQVQDVVRGVHGQDAQNRVAAADDEAPDRDDEVEQAEPEGVLARGVAGGGEAEQAGGEVDEVVPSVDGQDPERLVDLPWRAEARAVEEADDAGDRQDRADQRRVEPGRA